MALALLFAAAKQVVRMDEGLRKGLWLERYGDSRTASLAAVLTQVNPRAVENLHAWLDRSVGPWVWAHVGQPLLVRPAWLPVPLAGLVRAARRLLGVEPEPAALSTVSPVDDRPESTL